MKKDTKANRNEEYNSFRELLITEAHTYIMCCNYIATLEQFLEYLPKHRKFEARMEELHNKFKDNNDMLDLISRVLEYKTAQGNFKFKFLKQTYVYNN
jgi:glucosamine 6-phosphate synthetase-like amidotransferase/phosphosugar isomerase protein